MHFYNMLMVLKLTLPPLIQVPINAVSPKEVEGLVEVDQAEGQKQSEDQDQPLVIYFDSTLKGENGQKCKLMCVRNKQN